MLWVLVAAHILTGCTAQVGLSTLATGYAKPELTAMANPLGIVRLSADYKRFTGFCEHISSIPVYERGYGLNHCGILLEIN